MMEKLSYAQAEADFRKYPYFVNPSVAALSGATAEERNILMRRIAACVGDEATLRTLIGVDPEEFAKFYPDMERPELSTEDTIDSFISKFSSEAKAETPQIDQLVTAPAINYAAMMMEESDELPEDSDPTSSMLNSFLKEMPPKTVTKKKPVPEPKQQEHTASDATTVQTSPTTTDERKEETGEEPNLSEALLKVMIKNRNYSKALEIITELSLNNPKKSIYFADQMRFLQKLIKNQEKLAQNKSISN